MRLWCAKGARAIAVMRHGVGLDTTCFVLAGCVTCRYTIPKLTSILKPEIQLTVVSMLFCSLNISSRVLVTTLAGH